MAARTTGDRREGPPQARQRRHEISQPVDNGSPLTEEFVVSELVLGPKARVITKTFGEGRKQHHKFGNKNKTSLTHLYSMDPIEAAGR